MVQRVVAVSVLQFVLALVLGWLLGSLLQWGLGSEPGDAFGIESLSLLFGFAGIALAVWAVLLIVGAVRRKGLGWGVGGSILAALIAAVANLMGMIVILFAMGGAAIFGVGIAIEAGVVFFVAAVLGTLIARRIVRI